LLLLFLIFSDDLFDSLFFFFTLRHLLDLPDFPLLDFLELGHSSPLSPEGGFGSVEPLSPDSASGLLVGAGVATGTGAGVCTGAGTGVWIGVLVGVSVTGAEVGEGVVTAGG
jgi:hypothetical protein